MGSTTSDLISIDVKLSQQKAVRFTLLNLAEESASLKTVQLGPETPELGDRESENLNRSSRDSSPDAQSPQGYWLLAQGHKLTEP